MATYILKRLFLMIPIFLGITVISFAVLHLAPGAPTEMQTMMQPKVSLEARARLNAIYGLDKPLHIQYFDWLKRLVRFDFGRSFSSDNRPVQEK
ncbi:MAG: ABC transporter permease, partial [Deltaproteobacteria bacterium]|nr:ABC transporter permease [Deltaproteobacteria bacterium]